MEFILFVGLGVMTTIVLILLAVYLSNDTINQKTQKITTDFGRSVQQEVLLASQVNPGYSRTIIIPDRLDNKFEYEINTSTDYFFVTADGISSGFRLPPVNGSFQKGSNTLTNYYGVVRIAQP